MTRPIDIMRLENLTFHEFSLLLYHYLKPDNKDKKSLLERGLLEEKNNTVEISTEGIKLLKHIILINESEAAEFVNDDEFITKLREIFPKGRKEGTGYHWRGTTVEIKNKLKEFAANHPEYTKEEILRATANYVASFNGDHTYMQLLKYFIWKVKRDLDGKTFIDSQLLSYLENLESDNEVGVGDYTSTLR